MDPRLLAAVALPPVEDALRRYQVANLRRLTTVGAAGSVVLIAANLWVERYWSGAFAVVLFIVLVWCAWRGPQQPQRHNFFVHVALTAAWVVSAAAGMAEVPSESISFLYLGVIPLTASQLLDLRAARWWLLPAVLSAVAGYGYEFFNPVTNPPDYVLWRGIDNLVFLGIISTLSFTSRGLLDRYLEQVTERQKVILHQAMALAEVSASKGRFLANLSHEIRTPMNGVLGMTELLLSTPLSPAQKEQAEIIQNSGATLITLINDVLDLAKLDAGKLTLSRDKVGLLSLVSEIRQLFGASAQKKGLKVEQKLDEALPLFIWSDRIRLRQVISNLVANAIKFTESGGVHIQLRQRAELLRVEIEDTGIGIAKTAINRLFVPFEQVDNSASRRAQGSGLGLAICQEIIHRMGGQIGVESQVGQGSCFWFEIPLEAAPNHTPAPPADDIQTDNLANLRVLLAEDNDVNRKIGARFLERLGVHANLTENGKAAVNAVLESGPYDVILMDCQMPEMDGYQATQLIRQNPDPKIAQTPIIALTANALAEDRERSLAAGMNDHLAKPYSLAQLADTLRKWQKHQAA